MIRTAVFQVIPAALGVFGLAQSFGHLIRQTRAAHHPIRRWHYVVGLITAASAACSGPSATHPPTMSHVGSAASPPTAASTPSVTATTLAATAPTPTPTRPTPLPTPTTATQPNAAPEAPTPDPEPPSSDAEFPSSDSDPITDEAAAPNQADPPNDTTARPTYTVQPGDTLWAIAHDHLSHHHVAPVNAGAIASHWRQIIDLNQPRLQSLDPDLIYPGETILLPMI